ISVVPRRPLLFPQAEGLVLIWATDAGGGRTEDVATYPNFEDWKASSRSFERMGAFTTRGRTLMGADQAESVEAVQATPGLFETLRVRPALGRTFRSEEGEAGGGESPLSRHASYNNR